MNHVIALDFLVYRIIAGVLWTGDKDPVPGVQDAVIAVAYTARKGM